MNANHVVYRSLVVFASILFIALVVPAPVQSQQSCQSGTYTLSGNLKVTGNIDSGGTIQGANVKATASNTHCTTLTGAPERVNSYSATSYGSFNAYFKPMNCPAGKVITGVHCRDCGGGSAAQSGWMVIWTPGKISKLFLYKNSVPQGVNSANYPNGFVQANTIEDADGAACACLDYSGETLYNGYIWISGNSNPSETTMTCC